MCVIKIQHTYIQTLKLEKIINLEDSRSWYHSGSVPDREPASYDESSSATRFTALSSSRKKLCSRSELICSGDVLSLDRFLV